MDLEDVTSFSTEAIMVNNNFARGLMLNFQTIITGNKTCVKSEVVN